MTDAARLSISVSSDSADVATGKLRTLTETGKQTEGALSGVKSASGLMSVAMAGGATAVALLVGAATKAIQANRQFEKSLSDLSAITGATGDQMAYMKAQAMEIGATTSLSASEAAEAFKLVASAKPDLLESSAALNAVTRSAVTLAEAAGTSLPDAANALGAAMNQFGAGADQANRFINVMAAGAKFGSAEVEEVAESLKACGVSAAGAGVSFEETNAAIQSLASVSIKGGEAGTALRNIILKMDTSMDKSLRPSVVGLGQALQNLDAQNLSTTNLTKMFGLENVNAAKALLQSADGMKELTTNMTGTNTATEQAATRTNNLDGDMKQLSSSVEALSLVVGEKLNPVMRATVQISSEVATGMANWLDSISDAPSTLAGATYKLHGLYEEIQHLQEVQAEQTSKYGGVGILAAFMGDTDPQAEIDRLKGQAKELQETIAKFQGKPGEGAPEPTPKAVKPPREAPDETDPAAEKKAARAAAAAAKHQASLAKAKAAEFQTVVEGLRTEEEAIQASYDKRLAIILSNTEKGSAQQKALVKKLEADTEKDRNAALETVKEGLRTEEEALQASYDKRLAIILKNTEAGSTQQAELKKKLDEKFATESLGSFSQDVTIDDQLKTIDEEYAQRRELILSNTQLTEEMRTKLEEKLTKKRNAMVEQLETQKMHVILSAGSETFGALAELTASFGGKQSIAYKAMFAASKAFALADSIMKIQQGIANAAAMPFPANLAAIGTTIAATASVVSTISGTQPKGFRSGGYTGGGDPNAVVGDVHGQEYVFDAAATKRIGVGNLEQMRSGAKAAPAASAADRGGVGGVVVQFTQHIYVNGNGDNALEVAVRKGAKEGADEAYSRVLKDIVNNGDIRQQMRA